MPAESRELNLILRLKDEASKELKGFQGKVEKMRPTFKKMAVAGTVAFAGISAGVAKATQAAAEAEGSWNKFNTVFAEGSDEMRDFIEDLRKEMPTATHEIARMAADLQDLLVPMGVARDEAQGMSQGFLELANKVAAFNDVDPTQVLEAFKSGLSGSSEPLRRFGIDALETSLALRAVEEGLVESKEAFSQLEGAEKSSIRAQALLAQSIANSSDAIEGFADNQDSFIRRQQELQATTKDISVTLGNTFLPIIDDVLKAVLPIVKSFGEWAEENPKLARNIILATAAIAGIVAVVGTLGLVLPSIIAGFGALGTVLAFLAANPMVLITAAIALLFTRFMQLVDATGGWSNAISAMGDTIAGFLNRHAKPFIDFFSSIFEWIDKALGKLKSFISTMGEIGGKVGGAIGGAVSKIVPFADGGIVTQPTLGLVGEAGPEAIIPLSEMGRMGGGTNVTININGDVTGQEVVEKVRQALLGDIKRRVRV